MLIPAYGRLAIRENEGLMHLVIIGARNTGTSLNIQKERIGKKYSALKKHSKYSSSSCFRFNNWQFGSEPKVFPGLILTTGSKNRTIKMPLMRLFLPLSSLLHSEPLHIRGGLSWLYMPY